MRNTQIHYPDCPEVMIVKLAQAGDHGAFADLVRRQQSIIRNLLRRCCRNTVLADDLAQQTFLQAWLKINTLKSAKAFSAWLRRVAMTTWLQHARKKDTLKDSDELDFESGQPSQLGAQIDLDRALDELPDIVRTCVVLSYQESMSHGDIASHTDLPLGTVKSHIFRGSKRLRELLAPYQEKGGPGDGS